MAECAECGGVGLIQETREGRLVSVACACQAAAQARARVARAKIPAGFAGARLDSFRPAPHTKAAYLRARHFCTEFIPGLSQTQRQPGLLLTGSVGVGKTHLSVGVLRELIEHKGIEGRFLDLRELLDRLRSSYDDAATETQGQILRPILAADLVVVDELGAARPSDWVFETIELLIGGLYNRCTPTIVTTNLANLAAGAGGGGNEYSRAMRQETLGDRIGMRMWSRLQQMCVAVDMTGPDWRGKR